MIYIAYISYTCCIMHYVNINLTLFPSQSLQVANQYLPPTYYALRVIVP